MKVYVCGNPLLKEDSIPLKILPELQNKFPSIKFIDFDPTEDIPKEQKLFFIDTILIFVSAVR